MEIINLFTGTSLLYIDPAATSVLLSSITAIAVAVGASAIVIWRKLKKKADKALHRDPNANKEVEADLVITEGEADAAPSESAEPSVEPSATEPEEPARTE